MGCQSDIYYFSRKTLSHFRDCQKPTYDLCVFHMPYFFLATTSEPLTILVDIIFIVGIATVVAWYFYFYLKREVIGGFVGAIIISGFGAILILATLQTFLRDIIMWLMSPKLGTIQLSNVNLIVIFMGAYLSLYLLIKINYNKQRKD